MTELDQEGCCGPAMKVWLIICNVILLLLAIASLGIGIWVQTQPGFQWTAGSVGVGLIIVGVFLLFLALLGIFAALKKSRCLFAIYGTLLTIFFIAELAALAVAVAATSLVMSVQNEAWKTMDVEQQHAIGMFFGCCGVDESSMTADNRKYSNDGQTTCMAGDAALDGKESVADDSSTHTIATGVCEVFGLDYTLPGGEGATYVSFPKYDTAFLTESSCVPNKDTWTADEWDTCADASNSNCPSGCAVRANNQCRRGNDEWKTKDDHLEDPIPPQCLCPITQGKRPTQECRTSKAVIPLCDSKNEATFPFNVGLSDDWANVKDGASGVSEPVAACYAKLELWITEGVAPIIIIAFIFIYQLIQVIFAWALSCHCCGSGGKDGQASDV